MIEKSVEALADSTMKAGFAKSSTILWSKEALANNASELLKKCSVEEADGLTRLRKRR
jgi:hypothetical protein